MKKLLMCLCFTSLLFGITAISSGEELKTQSITINPLFYSRNIFNLGYETKDFLFQLPNTTDQFKIEYANDSYGSWQEVDFYLKYYPFGEMNGIYIAPMIGAGTANYSFYNTTIKFTGIGIGGALGIKKAFKNGLTFDAGIAAGVVPGVCTLVFVNTDIGYSW